MAKSGEHKVVTCLACGKTYRQSRSNQEFCSRECYYPVWKARQVKNNAKTKCAVCEKEFTKKTSKHKYCSEECSRQAEKDKKRVIGGKGKGHTRGIVLVPRKKCEVCGKDFYVEPARLKKGGGRFCSNRCKGLGTKGKEVIGHERVQRLCATCGKEFSVQPGQLKYGGGKYCSRKCLFEGKSTPSRKCKNCHKVFKVHTKSERKFCSRDCYIEWKKKNTKPSHVERSCKVCGEKFYVSPAVASYGQGRFCSRKCFREGIGAEKTGENNPKWRGGSKKYYGPSWYAQRRAARKRDNNQCRRCGKTQEELGESIQVHHIIRFHDFTNHLDANNLSNLVCLCRKCHEYAEANGIDFDLSTA